MAIQVLEENRKPTTTERFNQSFGNVLQGASKMGFGMAQQRQQNEAYRRLTGEDLSGLPSEDQSKMAALLLQGQQKKSEFQDRYIEDTKSYNTIKNRFGEDAANLWLASTEGGRTKIIGTLLENEQRGIGLQDKIVSPQQESPDQVEKPSFKVKDFDKGLTPKERAQRENARYEKALPLFQQSQQKLHSYDSMGEEIGVLQELSPQIGGWERLNINPQTGDLLIPALASPEAQQFVKTVNDFTMQAKDSYGARVTNFDLNQFMRRLPTLANSEEGRRRILEQMKIINDLNKLYEQSLHDVINEHGGIRKIDYDVANEIAYKKFLKDSKPLKADLRSLVSSDKKEFTNIIEQKKKRSPPGQVLMMTKDGNFGYVSKEEVPEAIKDGLTVQ